MGTLSHHFCADFVTSVSYNELEFGYFCRYVYRCPIRIPVYLNFIVLCFHFLKNVTKKEKVVLSVQEKFEVIKKLRNGATRKKMIF